MILPDGIFHRYYGNETNILFLLTRPFSSSGFACSVRASFPVFAHPDREPSGSYLHWSLTGMAGKKDITGKTMLHRQLPLAGLFESPLPPAPAYSSEIKPTSPLAEPLSNGIGTATTASAVVRRESSLSLRPVQRYPCILICESRRPRNSNHPLRGFCTARSPRPIPSLPHAEMGSLLFQRTLLRCLGNWLNRGKAAGRHGKASPGSPRR